METLTLKHTHWLVICLVTNQHQEFNITLRQDTRVQKLLLRWLLSSFPSDKLCALHRDHHHPRPEAAVSRCRRERVQHLPVSKPASVATATHFPCTCTVCSSEAEPDWLIVCVSGPGNLLCRFDWCVKNEWMTCWTGSGWCKVLGRFSERKDIVLMKSHSFV